MTYASNKPKRLPVRIKPEFSIRFLSRNIVVWTIPTAKIKPGKAYPSVKNELRKLKSLFLLMRIEKLIKIAISEHSMAAIRAKVIVFIAALKNALLKNDGL